MANSQDRKQPKEGDTPANTPNQLDSIPTTKLDLTQDYNINGTIYKAGKGVEVSNAHLDSIEEIKASGEVQRAYETTHHGAVPMHTDPQEATAQTPTRPLGAPNVIQEHVVTPVVNTGDVVEIKDPGDVGADESNKRPAEAAKASVEANKE